jgi:hypothetical protein
MDLIAAPGSERRPIYPTLGIRVLAPFRGMLGARDQLWVELIEWLDSRHIPYAGNLYLRFYVVDMAGTMDMEAGVITSERLSGDHRVHGGELPAGDYATLTYRDHSMRANKLLFQWAEQNQVVFDRSPDERGDRYGGRYERVLSDTRIERRKTDWVVQLNIRTV